jgi:hypothetical protein
LKRADVTLEKDETGIAVIYNQELELALLTRVFTSEADNSLRLMIE